MSPTALLPPGTSNPPAEIKGTSTRIGKRRRPQTMPLVNEIVEAAESGKRLEAAQVLSGFDELMSRQTDLEEQIEALTNEVAKYHSTSVFFKCNCLKVFGTIGELENHEREDHKKGLEEFICEFCGKVYKVKGAFDKHQEKTCTVLIEKRLAALAQNAYGMPVFMPTGPRMSLPHHPPFIDTCLLYQHGGVFQGLSAFEASTMDPTSVQFSQLALVPQAHLNFLPPSFAAHQPDDAPSTSGQGDHDSTPFSSPSPRAPARHPSAQGQNPVEEELDPLSQPATSFWACPPPAPQVQHLTAQFTLCPENNPRRPSDPYPFGAQGKQPEGMDGNLENQQPPIKRRRSEQVPRTTPSALLPAKHIASLPGQADSGPRYQTGSPREAKSHSPARTLPSEGVAPSEPTPTPLRAPSQGLSDASGAVSTDEQGAPDDVTILSVDENQAAGDGTGTTDNQWTFHRTDVYNGAPVAISVQTVAAPQQPRYGSQVLAPAQQYQLGEHSGLSVHLAETCGDPCVGFEDLGVVASGDAYPPDFLAGMDRQHPGYEGCFAAVFPGQEAAGWGHFTMPDWSGRGGGLGGFAM